MIEFWSQKLQCFCFRLGKVLLHIALGWPSRQLRMTFLGQSTSRSSKHIYWTALVRNNIYIRKDWWCINLSVKIISIPIITTHTNNQAALVLLINIVQGSHLARFHCLIWQVVTNFQHTSSLIREIQIIGNTLIAIAASSTPDAPTFRAIPRFSHEPTVALISLSAEPIQLGKCRKGNTELCRHNTMFPCIQSVQRDTS